jgi:hypothetical protein
MNRHLTAALLLSAAGCKKPETQAQPQNQPNPSPRP